MVSASLQNKINFILRSSIELACFITRIILSIVEIGSKYFISPLINTFISKHFSKDTEDTSCLLSDQFNSNLTYVDSDLRYKKLSSFELKLIKDNGQTKYNYDIDTVLLISANLLQLGKNDINYPCNPFAFYRLSFLEENIKKYEELSQGNTSATINNMLAASKGYIEAIKSDSKEVSDRYLDLKNAILLWGFVPIPSKSALG